jgi:hypothetical protein
VVDHTYGGCFGCLTQLEHQTPWCEGNFFKHWPCRRSLHDKTSRFWGAREGTLTVLIVLSNLWIETCISSLVHQDR